VITTIECSNCGASFPSGQGGYLYALSDEGERILCPHPGEGVTIKRVTGMDWEEAGAAGRVGFIRYCMCFSCGYQFELDLDRDIKQCPKCEALEVRSAKGALACECPHCHGGVFRERETGAII
jgi:hypothetical protein